MAYLQQIKNIGEKISIHSSILIGKGKLSSKVYEGLLEGRRQIAVKKIPLNEGEDILKEIRILCDNQVDSHPNILRYFCNEVLVGFFYIALELCNANLKDLVENSKKVQGWNSKVNHFKLLLQCGQGLEFLVSKEIIHGNLKPENILLKKEVNGQIIVKISDFKTNRKHFKCPEGKSGLLEKEDWEAPELALFGVQSTRADVYSFATVIYFVLSKGAPQKTYRYASGLITLERNFIQILNDTRGINQLLQDMTATRLTKRPSISEVIRHPIFWSLEEIIKFFQDVRTSLRDPKPAEVENATHKFSQELFITFSHLAPDWISHLTVNFQEEVREWNYKGWSSVDLIRALRDKYVHFEEMREAAKEEIGGKLNYVEYWLNIFPELLPITFKHFGRIVNPVIIPDDFWCYARE